MQPAEPPLPTVQHHAYRPGCNARSSTKTVPLLMSPGNILCCCQVEPFLDFVGPACAVGWEQLLL
jgi:hypothetical protein